MQIEYTSVDGNPIIAIDEEIPKIPGILQVFARYFVVTSQHVETHCQSDQSEIEVESASDSCRHHAIDADDNNAGCAKSDEKKGSTVVFGLLHKAHDEKTGKEILSVPSTWTTAQCEAIRAILVFGHPTIDKSTLEQFPKLVVVSNFGVGIDHISVTDAFECNVQVGNTPNVLNKTVADLTMGLLLAAARHIVQSDAFVRDASAVTFPPCRFLGSQVSDSVLGIVGMGRIGLQVAKRASSFDMKVLYHNRSPIDTHIESKMSLTYCSELHELLTQSDFIVLLCPLTDSTYHLIGECEFACMKSTAVLINVARGGVVDTQALTHALATRCIAAAALDVTEPEPLPRDHALLGMDNVILTPHIGSATVQTRIAMLTHALDNLSAGLQGRPLLSPNTPTSASTSTSTSTGINVQR
jgi:glyoxylate reductase